MKRPYGNRFRTLAWWLLLLAMILAAAVPFVPVLEVVVVIALFWPAMGQRISQWLLAALEG